MSVFTDFSAVCKRSSDLLRISSSVKSLTASTPSLNLRINSRLSVEPIECTSNERFGMPSVRGYCHKWQDDVQRDATGLDALQSARVFFLGASWPCLLEDQEIQRGEGA